MRNIAKIEDYIFSGCNKEKRIGLELEHFVCKADYEIATYEDVVVCLEEMKNRVGARAYEEDGKLLGFIGMEYSVSLEPGCQLEISIAPREDMGDIEGIYKAFRVICDEILGSRGLMLLETGIHPLVESGLISVDELPLLPRKRYEYMDAYFRKTGSKGRYMMRATASTQISIDYESEEDAMDKMRVLEKLSPILALLTECRNGTRDESVFAPFLLRTQIWQDVDAKRCGYFPGTLKADYTFADYARYVYETPCILLQKDGEVIDLGECSAKDYYGNNNMDTEEHVLSMFFPMVRLKKYIEYRVADSMPIGRALSYATLIQKIVYEPGILSTLKEMLEDIREEKQITEAEGRIIKDGYQASVYGKNVGHWIRTILDLAMANATAEERQRMKALVNLPLINEEYAQLVRGNEASHLESAAAIKEYLLNSTAKYHERVVRTLYLPKLFTQKEWGVFDSLITTLYGIFRKVIAEYERNPAYRALFGFSDRLEKLILRPKKYACDIPIARIDVFYNEETGEFKFCEFNTDGTSAMNEDRELNHAFKLSKAHQKFLQKYRVEGLELFDTWVEQVLCLYRQFCQDESKIPNVAIVDFMESATINEFEIFRQRFQQQGITAQICDIRNLTWDGQSCYTEDGMKIDVIYRRAVTSDIMAHYEEVQPFIAAVESNRICLLGDFRTQIVHNKILYKVLHLEQTMQLLTKEEQIFVKAHVPMTVSLESIEQNPQLFERVMKDKNKWIIKPEDSYGSKGVKAGEECTEEEWRQFVQEKVHEGYILQEFVEPYRLRNIDLLAGNPQWITTSNLTGLYVYNEKLKGMYSRVSFDKMISTQYNEMSLPTMLVDLK